ncbi:hypothetical protein [Ferrovibrio sp.]|uniref:hypothetical protein n=1 Tax=Ferrovibrio sp. TaxID=1917215 RepID=UPI000CC7CF7E|nr:hypothetical protein [Ferrovibrio sp.]PJI42429.1 MAG: hypothetical protein CTR53_08470 [Ferrovibrio sp.]
MVEIASSKKKYLNPLNDIPDQALFFGLFAVGGLAIWFMKMAGFHQYVVTAFPVAIMFGYAGVALVTKRYRIREDKIGDNIYYLGFLYTLVSLAYALYRLGRMPGYGGGFASTHLVRGGVKRQFNTRVHIFRRDDVASFDWGPVLPDGIDNLKRPLRKSK